MKNKMVTMGLAAALSLAAAMTAFAGWEQTDNIWRYEDNGAYVKGCWRWIDGNGDGIAECYYFDQDGVMQANTVIDGSAVNENGAWTVDGVVQSKAVQESSGSAGGASQDNVLNFDADTNNPFADDDLYLKMKKSAFDKLYAMSDDYYKQTRIRLELDDVTYEQSAHSKDVMFYLCEEIGRYCMLRKGIGAVVSVEYGGMMADHNLSSNKKHPYFVIKDYESPYLSTSLYSQLEAAVIAKVSATDFNSIEDGEAVLDFPEVPINEEDLEMADSFVLPLRKKIMPILKSYKPVSIKLDNDFVLMENGQYYLRFHITMRIRKN